MGKRSGRRAGRRRRRVALAALIGAGLVAGGVVWATSTTGAPRPVRRAAPVATTAPFTVPTTVPPPPPPVPPVFYNGRRDRPLVALTFDSNLTDAMILELDSGKVASFANVAVIDELDRMQVPATIFLAGKWIERYPDLTRRLAADPLFELGSHSYAHEAFHQPCYGLGTLPAAEMEADVAHSEALLRQFTPRPTPYFRFPGGCFDDTALHAIAPTGVTVIQYDLPSGDAFGTSVPAIVHNVLANTQPGSIIVMHITGGNTAPLTAYALPAVVVGLRQKGFTLVRLSDLLAPLASGN
jgi:peptidoglycan-N-acetylglucosamine deacetylase